MDTLDVLVFYVPIPETDRVLESLFSAGAGRVGKYDRCAFVVSGQGQFRPNAGAKPALGQVGEPVRVEENRVEITFPRGYRDAVVAALEASHPYEEPVFHVVLNDRAT